MSRIVTFYSFKGGVGRTMALANISVLLAMRGKRVLMVDWDLEAPGLDRYFADHMVQRAGRGVLDLLVAAGGGKPHDWRSYVTAVNLEVDGELHILSAGAAESNYSARLQGLDWDSLFAEKEGGAYIEHLRTEWRADYDFILVDSRTGYTDSGGVCTIQLPDVVAAVFTANEQSFAGVIDAVAQMQAARQRLAVDRMPLVILPIPSRFDGRVEVAEAERWTKRFAEQLGPYYDAWLPKGTDHRRVVERTKVPHVPYFSFGERLAVLEVSLTDPEQMGYAYDVYAHLLVRDFLDGAQVVLGQIFDVTREAADRLGRGQRPQSSESHEAPWLGILIALQEEFEAIREILPTRRSFRSGDDSFFEFVTPGGRVILGALMAAMSNEAAAATAERLADRGVALLAVIGIARSLSDDARLGDVVVPDVIDLLRSGTGATERATNEHELRLAGHPYRTARRLIQAVLDLQTRPEEETSWRQWQHRCSVRRESLGLGDIKALELGRREPRVVVGHLASGTEVVSATTVGSWRKALSDRMYVAIDVESGGAAVAAHGQASALPMIALRGISDLGDKGMSTLDRASRGAWRELAAQNAADLLATLLDSDLLTDAAEMRLMATTPGGQARRVRFKVPLPLAYFIGRERELEALDEALAVLGHAGVWQAITGQGGVGKSQLAAQYMRKHADEYDIAAWVRAEDGGVRDLAELAGELGLEVGDLTPAERATRALRWLGSCKERWLLVLDNVADTQQLAQCCPASGNGCVIVTSRDRAMAQFGPTMDVGVFDELTAVEYLVQASGREDRVAAARLARALGYLPLALSHAAAYCAAGTTFDDYRDLLEALPAAELFDSQPQSSYSQAIASTWRVSLQAAEHQARLAPQVLDMAAYLAPDAIPLELFDVLVGDPAEPSHRKALRDAFNALHRLNLAQIDDTSLSIHRLVQKTIRDEAGGNQAGADMAVLALAAAFPTDHAKPTTWALSERLLPHALALSTVTLPSQPAGQTLVELSNRTVDYLLWVDRTELSVFAARSATACATRILGPEHPNTLTAQNNLATSYRQAGRTNDAITLGERVLADCERILGPEHPNTLTTRANLANSYRQAGRTNDAITLGEQVLADRERILGPEHPDTLNTRANLASSYHDAGRTNDAITLGEQVLADRERILGPEHPNTLTARHNLATSYHDAGRTNDAITIFEQVLADRERILGPEHPDTLTARASLAASYWQARRTGDAITIYELVLADLERILGTEHPDTLTARASLATFYRQAGRTSDAIALGERVLAASERILGHEHPDTLSTRASLVSSYRQAGRISDAIALGEQVLEASERILGAGHPDTRSARANLAKARQGA